MRVASRNVRLVTRMGALGAVFLLFAVLAGNTGGDCMPIQPQTLCETDADCAALSTNDMEGRWECIDGVCELFDDILPPERCRGDADCRPGQRCELDLSQQCCPPGALCIMNMPPCEGVCVPDSDPEDCFSDEDCRSNEQCVVDWEQCWRDGDLPCAPGERCGGPCPGRCEPRIDPDDCRTDADCGPGALCQLTCIAWDCASSDPTDCVPPPEECRGVCVPAPRDCESDADCAPDEQCVIAWDLCWRDGELPCGAGERCGGPCLGTCEPRVDPGECRGDDDCGPGEVCLMACAATICEDGAPCPPPECWGQCVRDPDPRECWSDDDCGPGEFCQFDPEEGMPCPPPECFGQCVPRYEPECDTDADCGPNARCEILPELCGGPAGGDADLPCAGTGDPDDPSVPGCLPPEPWPCGGVCVPDPDPSECSADWDCAADERCETSWEACGWCDDPTGFDCRPCVGQCVPIKECLSDADCPGGTVCDADYWGCPAPMPCAADDENCVAFPCVGVCTEHPGWPAP